MYFLFYLSIYLCIYLSIHLLMYLFVHLLLDLFIYLFVHSFISYVSSRGLCAEAAERTGSREPASDNGRHKGTWPVNLCPAVWTRAVAGRIRGVGVWVGWCLWG